MGNMFIEIGKLIKESTPYVDIYNEVPQMNKLVSLLNRTMIEAENA